MKIAVAQAGEDAADAPKGSPVQLVGDFYNAYMDTEKRDTAGIEPLRSALEHITTIDLPQALTRFLARMARVGGPLLLVGFGPSPDLADSQRYAIYGLAGGFGLEERFEDVFNDLPNSPRRAAYRSYIRDALKIAGYPADEANRIADLTLEIESELHAGKLTPEEGVDPRNRYNPMSLAQVQEQIPELDLEVYFHELVVLHRPSRRRWTHRFISAVWAPSSAMR